MYLIRPYRSNILRIYPSRHRFTSSSGALTNTKLFGNKSIGRHSTKMSSSPITCSACLTGFLKDSTPTGSVEKLYGLDIYIARPSSRVIKDEDGQVGNAKMKPKGVVVIKPDLFGWETSNARLLADSYARDGGFVVLLPDFMCGTAPAPWTMSTMHALLSPSPSLFSTIFKKPTYFLQIITQAIPFLIRNRSSIVLPRILSFHRSLRTSPPAELSGLKIGSAGFCWGGKWSILLSHSRTEDGEKGLIDTAFVAHPSKMAFPVDWEGIAKPFCMVIGDVDSAIKIEHVREIEAVLRRKDDERGEMGESEVVVYEGAKHGFAMRADPGDGSQGRMAEKAKELAVEWFRRWLA